MRNECSRSPSSRRRLEAGEDVEAPDMEEEEDDRFGFKAKRVAGSGLVKSPARTPEPLSPQVSTRGGKRNGEGRVRWA